MGDKIREMEIKVTECFDEPNDFGSKILRQSNDSTVYFGRDDHGGTGGGYILKTWLTKLSDDENPISSIEVDDLPEFLYTVKLMAAEFVRRSNPIQ